MTGFALVPPAPLDVGGTPGGTHPVTAPPSLRRLPKKFGQQRSCKDTAPKNPIDYLRPFLTKNL